jgi:hypothetical protein
MSTQSAAKGFHDIIKYVMYVLLLSLLCGGAADGGAGGAAAIAASPLGDGSDGIFKTKFMTNDLDYFGHLKKQFYDDFDPAYALEGEVAISILDWERRAILQAVGENPEHLEICYIDEKGNIVSAASSEVNPPLHRTTPLFVHVPRTGHPPAPRLLGTTTHSSKQRQLRQRRSTMSSRR